MHDPSFLNHYENVNIKQIVFPLSFQRLPELATIVN